MNEESQYSAWHHQEPSTPILDHDERFGWVATVTQPDCNQSVCLCTGTQLYDQGLSQLYESLIIQLFNDPVVS